MKTLGIWEHRALFAYGFMAMTDSLLSVAWGLFGLACMVLSYRRGEP